LPRAEPIYSISNHVARHGSSRDRVGLPPPPTQDQVITLFCRTIKSGKFFAPSKFIYRKITNALAIKLAACGFQLSFYSVLKFPVKKLSEQKNKDPFYCVDDIFGKIPHPNASLYF
jgi:hypothetical protein